MAVEPRRAAALRGFLFLRAFFGCSVPRFARGVDAVVSSRLLRRLLRSIAAQLCIDMSVNAGAGAMSAHHALEVPCAESIEWLFTWDNQTNGLCALQIERTSGEICAHATAKTGARMTKTCRV
jgi:hypothetical protein